MQKVALIGIVLAAVILLAIFATQQKPPVETTTTPAKPAAEVVAKPAPTAPAVVEMTAAEAIAAADAALKRAASVNGEWRDSRNILKAAEKAAEAGDEAKAIKLAKKAQAQGDLGYTQSTTQPDASTPPYLTN